MIGILGIDPGSHGAMCFVRLDGLARRVHPFSRITMAEVANLIEIYSMTHDLIVYIEEVHSMPKDGKVQAFSFGKNYGTLLGIITALRVPRVDVLPAKWQSELKLRVRGLEYRDKKRALKAEAEKRFPWLSVTLDNCDALLIAEYGRQKELHEQELAKRGK